MARNAYARVTIEGQDVTAQLEKYIVSFQFTDSIEGQSDVAELTLQDCEGIFASSSFPQRGSSANVEMVRANWNADDTVEVLNIGAMELDEVLTAYPPLTCKIKFNSVCNSMRLRGVEKFRSWEKTNIRQIAQDIASDAGCSLFFDADDFQLQRVEQSQESSLALLKKLCDDNGLILKVSNNRIIIADALKYESQAPVTSLHFGSSAIVKFSASATISKVYGDSRVVFKSNSVADYFLKYFDMFKGNVGIKMPSIGRGVIKGAGDTTLRVLQKVSSEAEARRLAKAKLREANKDEIKLAIEFVGNFIYVAGNVINLDDSFGVYAGNYIIDKAVHAISGSGYRTMVEVHRCLNY